MCLFDCTEVGIQLCYWLLLLLAVGDGAMNAVRKVSTVMS